MQDHRLLILSTTSERTVMQQLGLLDRIGKEIPVPNVNTARELSIILQQAGLFESGSDITEALNELREYTGTDEIGVGISRVLQNVETAKASNDRPRKFAEAMASSRAMLMN